METWVAVVILCEVILTLLCVFGMIHEEKIVRVEHAFVKAVIWTLWEKIVHKEVDICD